MLSWLILLASLAPGSGWVAYGDLRGHIEPCGCDPTTDLGGIRRLAGVVAREKAAASGLAVLNLGNNLPPPGQHDVKVPFLLEHDALNAPVASLLNRTELERLKDVEAFARKDALHYVLSNANAKVPAQASVTAGEYVIYGYVYASEVAKLVEPVSPKLLDAWRAQLKSAAGKHKVLLFSGSDGELKQIVAKKLFDTIVSSNRAPMDTDPGTAEKNNEAMLQRLADPVVNMVPLGGQGLLRGGNAMFQEAKSIGSLLGEPPPPRDALPFKTGKLVTWMTPDSPDSDAGKALYAKYDAAAKAAFLGASAERAKDLATSPFTGAEACKSCHVKEAAVYGTMKHAHAFATLQAKHKEQDPECVTCHTVGAKVKGGFVSLEASPQLVNVQCENCHGAGKAHAADPKKAKMLAGADARGVCTTCHNAQHSPKFDFKAYWPRIAHGGK